MVGRLLIESTPLFLRDHAALDEARSTSQWPARVSIGVGTRETEEEEIVKAAAAEMEALHAAILKGSPRTVVQLVVEPDATHSSAAWRRRLPAALEFLWPVSTPSSP